MKTTMIKKFQKMMIKKALKNGIDENFGQNELRLLKDKIGYNPYGNIKERKIVEDIDFLNNWLMIFDYEQLKDYK